MTNSHSVYKIVVGAANCRLNVPHTRETMPDDWIGLFCPFYPKNTKQKIINDRLLMNGNDAGEIIPFGKIFGITYETLGIPNPIYLLENVPVGQEDSKGNLFDNN